MHALLPVSLAPDLAAYLGSGERKARAWFAMQQTVEVDFSDRSDCFRNLNRPEDHRRFSDRTS
jgi:molybdopterin-guanine dinucleotide biosynthesis protein A